MSLYLGIDTSNYTTSVAAVGDEQVNIRKIIDIKEGMRGIRQSDGVFVHLKELPQLFVWVLFACHGQAVNQGAGSAKGGLSASILSS